MLTKREQQTKLENEERNKELQDIEEAKNIIIKAEDILFNKRLHNIKNPHDTKDLTGTEKIIAEAKETLDTLEKNRKYVFKKLKKSLKEEESKEEESKEEESKEESKEEESKEEDSKEDFKEKDLILII